jgi:hypothetical protein
MKAATDIYMDAKPRDPNMDSTMDSGALNPNPRGGKSQQVCADRERSYPLSVPLAHEVVETARTVRSARAVGESIAPPRERRRGVGASREASAAERAERGERFPEVVDP